MRPVLLRVYWAVRVLAYLVTLPAAIVYLYAKAADPPLAERALYAIGVGFVFFFLSYALRIALRLLLSRDD